MSEMHARKTNISYSLNPSSRKVENFIKAKTMPLSPSERFDKGITLGENSISSMPIK